MINSLLGNPNMNHNILYELALAAESADLKRDWSVEKANGILEQLTAEPRVVPDLTKCSFEELTSLVELYDAVQYFALQFKDRRLSRRFLNGPKKHIEKVKARPTSRHEWRNLEIIFIRFELFVNLSRHINGAASDGGDKEVRHPCLEDWESKKKQLVRVYDHLKGELESKCGPFTKRCQAQPNFCAGWS